jgi:hypothetical protein
VKVENSSKNLPGAWLRLEFLGGCEIHTPAGPLRLETGVRQPTLTLSENCLAALELNSASPSVATYAVR